MQKNVAGQRIGVQMVSASDGTAFTGSVTVYVTGDAGSQAIGSVGSGVCTHEGNGYHSYAPAQAETNFDLIAFTFVGSGAVPVTVQVYTAINPVTAVPTAEANATAVRSELTTELGRIDVATSTRLASASYTAPDNASIASIKASTDNLPADPADASDIAAAFVTVNSKLDAIDDYVDSEVAAIKAVTDKLDGMLALDGLVYQYTANALELGASSGGTVYVYPMSMEQEPRNTHATITVYTEETGSQYFFAYDSTGAALSLTGKTLEFRVADTKSQQRLYTAKTSDGTLTISLGNKVTFTKSTKFTRFANTDVTYSLRDMDAGGEVLLDGQIELMWAP